MDHSSVEIDEELTFNDSAADLFNPLIVSGVSCEEDPFPLLEKLEFLRGSELNFTMGGMAEKVPARVGMYVLLMAVLMASSACRAPFAQWLRNRV